MTTPVAQRCFRHPTVETYARCTRCERPICPDCMVPASVGHQCPECVSEGRRHQRVVDVRKVGNRPTYVTYAVIAASVVMTVLAGGGTSVDALHRYGGAFGFSVREGEWWRLLTPMFLHIGLLHIAFNMLALYFYGSALERLLGSVRYGLLFIASGFLGNSLFVAMDPCVVGAGASGAVFGVFGAFAAYYFRRRRASALADQMLRGIIGLIAINLVLGFAIAGVGNWAHIGGLVGGTAIGTAMDERGPRRGWRGPAIAGVAIAAVMAAGVLVVLTRVVWPADAAFLRSCFGR